MLYFMDPHDGPVIEGLEAHEIVFGKEQPQYRPLRGLVNRTFGDTEVNKGEVLTRWTLTESQRVAVAQGADIYIEVSTFGLPLQPLRVAVHMPPEATPGVETTRETIARDYGLPNRADPFDDPDHDHIHG